MGLKLTSASNITYNQNLLPSEFTLALRLNFDGQPVGDKVYLQLTGPNKVVSWTWGRQSLSTLNARTTILYTEPGVQTFTLATGYTVGAPRTILIGYSGGKIYLYNNTLWQSVFSPFTNFTSLRVQGGVDTNITVDSLAIWNTLFTDTEIGELTGDFPSHHFYQPSKLTFFHKYFNAANHPYILGGNDPAYTGIDFNELVPMRNGSYIDTVSSMFSNHGPDLPAPPTEYTINITQSVKFSAGVGEESDNQHTNEAGLGDNVRFVNELGSNIRYKTWTDFLTFIEEIASTIKILSIDHYMFLVELWESEHDTLAVDAQGEYMNILSRFGLSLNLNRSIDNLAIIYDKMEAYKVTPAQDYES